MKRLKLLVVIVDRQIVDKVADTVSLQGAAFSHICYGRGTANNDLLNLLGLGETEKGIVFASVSSDSLEKIYSDLDYLYDFRKPGGGISFTLPISAVGGPATLKILNGDKE